jgi:TRAP-type C4-dicarboxylate transport system permease small subunit
VFNRNLENFTIEEFLSKKKTLRVIVYLLSLLIFLFMGYLGYVLYMGIWTSNHLAGIISLVLVISVIASNSALISGISKEIKKKAINEESDSQ